MGVAAAGVGLDGIAVDLIALAEVHQALHVEIRRQGAHKGPLPLQDLRRAGKAQLGQLRRAHAAEVRVGHVQHLGHRSGLQELPEARGLGSGRAEAVQQLLLRQAQQLARHSAGGKGPHHRGGVPVFIGAGIDRRADFRAGLIARDDGLDHRLTAFVQLLAQGEGGGYRDDGQVGDRRVVSVVQIHHMAGHRVEGRRLFSRLPAEAGLHHGRLRRGDLARHVTVPDLGLFLLRSGQRHADEVLHAELGGFHRLRGEAVKGDAVEMVYQLPCVFLHRQVSPLVGQAAFCAALRSRMLLNRGIAMKMMDTISRPRLSGRWMKTISEPFS